MTALIVLLLAAAPSEYVKVEVRGTLRFGLMAIGGETTGTTLSARGVTWELAFTRAADRSRAARLDGKTVVVTGCLESRPGVEVRQRTIVTVTSLREAASAPVSRAPLPSCPPESSPTPR